MVESRRALNPDIEALNRAVRRYEKRTALTALQTDTRFQQLEAQTRDAIALAAAAQRANLNRRQSYAFTLIDWACACIVVPTQIALSIINLPGRIVSRCLLAAQRILGLKRPSPQPRSKSSKGKSRAVTGSKYASQGLPPKSSATSSMRNAQQQQQQQQSFESVWGAAR